VPGFAKAKPGITARPGAGACQNSRPFVCGACDTNKTPGFSWFGMISGADLGGRGNLNCPQARRSPTPVPGSRRRNLLEATRALTGCRSFFQQAAPGAACFFRHRQHRKPGELSDSGPNVQMGGDWWQAARKCRLDDIK